MNIELVGVLVSAGASLVLVVLLYFRSKALSKVRLELFHTNMKRLGLLRRTAGLESRLKDASAELRALRARLPASDRFDGLFSDDTTD